MAYSQKKRDYNHKYSKENFKRVPLDMQFFQYAELKAAADSVGEPVNTFIKKAISDRIKRLNSGTENTDASGK